MIKWILALLVAIVFFYSGRYMTRIFGFDPPYSWYYFGMALEFVSLILGSISLIAILRRLLLSMLK